MMKSTPLLVSLLLGVVCALPARAANEIIAVRKAARPLIAQERYQEAIDLYVTTGEAAEDDRVQAYCFDQAAQVAAGRLEDTDQALSLAGRIRDPQRREASTLQLLEDAGQYDRVIKQFAETPIETWPMELRLDSYCARARAYLEKDKPDQARDDLEAASRCHGNKGRLTWACYQLGMLYEQAYNDTDKAMASYVRGLDATRATYAWRNRCFLRRVELLLEQGDAQPALTMFDTVDYAGLPSDYWRGAFYLQEAAVHAELDQFGQEIKVLTQVLRLPEAVEGHKASARTRINELVGPVE